MEKKEWSRDGKSYRYSKDGWEFLYIEGLPFERGVSYGELLAREIRDAIREASRLVMLQTGIEWEFLKDSKISILHKWKEHLCRKPYKEFLEEMIAPSLHSMFVTPKDVDETVKRLSYTISEGLNMAFEQA